MVRKYSKRCHFDYRVLEGRCAMRRKAYNANDDPEQLYFYYTFSNLVHRYSILMRSRSDIKVKVQVRISREDREAAQVYAQQLYGIKLSQLLRIIIKMLIDEKLELVAINIKRDGAGNVIFQG